MKRDDLIGAGFDPEPAPEDLERASVLDDRRMLLFFRGAYPFREHVTVILDRNDMLVGLLVDDEAYRVEFRPNLRLRFGDGWKVRTLLRYSEPGTDYLIGPDPAAEPPEPTA